jgi:C-3',4' desaturase CrtD
LNFSLGVIGSVITITPKWDRSISSSFTFTLIINRTKMDINGNTNRVIVIGAGVGGLTTAALLAKAGMAVTVLEAHVYPGGSAGTFYYQGYRFDAGATLAGGFYSDGPMDRLGKALGVQWPARPIDLAMRVHLPDGFSIDRWGDERRWIERRRKFGEGSLPFWRWQEATADALWELALENPAWPPQSISQGGQLIKAGLRWLSSSPADRLSPKFISSSFSTVRPYLATASDRLRLFVDGQLLISAQTTSDHANAWYGASALDLPRRGVVELDGGMGTIATRLAQAVERHGGEVLLRNEVTRIVRENGRIKAVETRRGDSFPADVVVANLPPWNIAKMLAGDLPGLLKHLSPDPPGWGAFVAYLGLDNQAIPDDLPLHNQVIQGRPLGEGNSVFLSISPSWDLNRSPLGKRAVTVSTHTTLSPWWDLFENDQDRYDARKRSYTDRLISAVARVIPDVREATELVLPGTPVTFQRFTRRAKGWVGGFPQVSLFQARPPRLMPGLWMVGDSIFPGQSTAAVALGGMRIANQILSQHGFPVNVLDLRDSHQDLPDKPSNISIENEQNFEQPKHIGKVRVLDKE